jgi:hypothetical protein
MAKLRPGAGKKHAREVEAATERYEGEKASHQQREHDPAADAYSSEPRVEPAVDQAHP